MRIGCTTLIVAAVACASSSSQAEPLLALEKGEPRPAVITGWSGEDKKIELTLKQGADPQTVAAAIEANIDRVRVKLRANKLLVIGMPREELLRALTEIDMGVSDLDALAEAAAMEDDFDTGSSLRAKKIASLDQLLGDPKTTAYGRVVAVQSAAFPRTRVSIYVLRGPQGDLQSKIRKGRQIHFQPVLPARIDDLAYSDAATVANIGAWYLKKGDLVRIKVGKPLKNGYEAQVIAR
ncbi:MAG: hypothetical protein AAF449_17395 [Myxococcota bacterium]